MSRMNETRTPVPAYIYQGPTGQLFLHTETFKVTMPMSQQLIMDLNMSLNLDLINNFDQAAYDRFYGYAPPLPEEPTPLEKEVNAIKASINAEIKKYGYFSTSTCDTNSYGWSKLKHAAMEYIQRNPPEGVIVSRAVKFEVTDWKIVPR